MRKYFSVRGGAGDLTKPDINTRPQDNLYLAVNSEWLSKAKIPFVLIINKSISYETNTQCN